MFADFDGSFQGHEDPFVSTSDERFAAFSSSLFGGFGPRQTPLHPPGLTSANLRARAARRRPIFQAQRRLQQDELLPMPGLGIDATASYAPSTHHSKAKISLADSVPEQPSPTTRSENVGLGEDESLKTTTDLDETSFPALPTPTVPQVMAEQQKISSEIGVRGQIKKAKPSKDDSEKKASVIGSTVGGDVLDRESRKSLERKKGREKKEQPTKAEREVEQGEDGTEIAQATAERSGGTMKADQADVAKKASSTDSPALKINTGSDTLQASRPSTPASTSATPMKQAPQPRTLRVTSTSTTETPSTPARAATPTVHVKHALQKATPAVSRHGSRRPSVSSSAPSRNPDQDSRLDTESMVAEFPSRASSPAPMTSRVGSAPVRSKTKSQVKKDRQERAKLADDPSDAGTGTQSEVVEVAPVMGRQTKKSKAKKPTGRTNEVSKVNTPNASRPASPGPTPIQDSAPPEAHAGKQLAEAEGMPSRKHQPDADIADVLEQAKSEKPEAMTPAGIIKELKATGDLGAEFAKLFLEPLLRVSNGKSDPLTVDDIWSMATPKTLTPAEAQNLQNGLAVRREGPSSKASSRLMISPTMKCLPRLTKEQENRYLELEKKIIESKPPYKYTHHRQKDKLVHALATIDEMLKDMTAILTRPPKVNARTPAPPPQSQIVAKQVENSPDTGSAKPQIQPPPQPSYGADALSYLNQYILPPLPSAPRPNPLKPQTAPANQVVYGTQGMPQAPQGALTAPGTAIPRTYTTGHPTYSVKGVQGPAAAFYQPNTGATTYTNTSYTTTTTVTTSHAPPNAAANSSATLDIQKLIHGDFGKLTQSDIKKLRKEDIDRLSPSDISALAQNAANAAAAAVGDLRSLNLSGSLGPDAAGLRNADFEKIQNLGSKALKGQALSGADLANLRSLGSGSGALTTTGSGAGALSQTASAEAIKTALANAVNGVVQAAAAVANQTSQNQIQNQNQNHASHTHAHTPRPPLKASDDVMERIAYAKQQQQSGELDPRFSAALAQTSNEDAYTRRTFSRVASTAETAAYYGRAGSLGPGQTYYGHAQPQTSFTPPLGMQAQAQAQAQAQERMSYQSTQPTQPTHPTNANANANANANVRAQQMQMQTQMQAQQPQSVYPQRRPPTVEEAAKALEVSKEENRGYDRRMVGMVKRNRKVAGLV